MLHIVNKSPFQNDSFISCMGHASAESTVLLIEDGVYAALQGSSVADKLGAGARVVALQSDVAARGIAANLAEGIETVDYDGFVELVEVNDRVQSWL